MIDFLLISTRTNRNGTVEIYPKFRLYPKSSDLMIRGGDFYAIWLEEKGVWSTDEGDALRLIDSELEKYAKDYEEKYSVKPKVFYMWDSESGMIDVWHKYCQKQLRDSFHTLDNTLIFSNMETKKEDYASKKLSYPLEKGSIKNFEKVISTLYSEEERHKIEWAIGSIVTGDSKKIQKFMVLYGAQGTGKSTIINLVEKLFEGYFSVFNAKRLGSSSNSFALEDFKTNPLVAIQHDGDLSRIEDNTLLNSLVSHELMTVNEKYKSTYTNKFKAFLFMGTNKPVKITDAKSGLIRRLIDVTPSGNKLTRSEYNKATKGMEFELGAIAYHCKEVYLKNPSRYDDYIPTTMLGASNDFYNFVMEYYTTFKRQNSTTLKSAWEMYKTYCEEAKVAFPYSQRNFKEELKNYFKDFEDKVTLEDGTTVRNKYTNFLADRFESEIHKIEPQEEPKKLLLDYTTSLFDKLYSNCLAQYATSAETPYKAWDKVKSVLSSLDTSKLHYVKVPENHIVIDFDLKDEDGNKSLERNLIEAAKWPKTYAEISKSGNGVHLHYIYSGDVTLLSRTFSENIEIKTFTGGSSLRRKFTKCNNEEIAIISSGLPLREEKKMLQYSIFINEQAVRRLVENNLRKKYHPNTAPSIQYIYKILNDAYDSGMTYDLSDMKNDLYAFAAQSTNQAEKCMSLVDKMKFKSEDKYQEPEKTEDNEKPIVFFDIEIFPNLFLVNYKMAGENNPVVRLINPSVSEIEELVNYSKLIGFNCRRYDNHILYGALLGYSIKELFELSQNIINSGKGKLNAFFGQAYNLSYTDVYDFAREKKSLKKWEIELGISHVELGLPWDQPVPEERWTEVAEYCDNDVIATEKVFNHLQADWIARQILAEISNGSVNDTTNTLTTKVIFGTNRNPQSSFYYRNLAEPVHELPEDVMKFLREACPEMMSQKHGDAKSLLPYFPGYKYEYGKSTYRGEEVGEGGYVDAIPGIHTNVALLDVASMHPHSLIAEILFGVSYTTVFRDIVRGRVIIKHENWEALNDILGGKLTKYVEKIKDGSIKSNDLANALKIAINSVYGLTSAKFKNAFKDIRNIDNIVAKRGALFMIDLKHFVQDLGYTVAHIKTDSIKIPNADRHIIEQVMNFGKKYGYTFEHEATYDRMCLVNNAVYIARYKDAEACQEMYGYIPGDNKKKGNQWTAIGKQFAVPYLFKKLFSKEPIQLKDMCETFSVKTAIYLDMNENLPDIHHHEKELEKLERLFKNGRIGEEEYKVEKIQFENEIAKGHDYRFVGKVGSFCPVLAGKGGGELYRKQDDKYHAVAGTTGYRWIESELVNEEDMDDLIDKSFYENLVNDAIDSIKEYGDYEWFVSNEPSVFEPLKKFA